MVEGSKGGVWDRGRGVGGGEECGWVGDCSFGYTTQRIGWVTGKAVGIAIINKAIARTIMGTINGMDNLGG